MAARHITKCPECERVTGDMVNSALAIDRTEYDGKHCQRCIDKKKYKCRGLPPPGGRVLFVTGKKNLAIWGSRIAGSCGIR